MNSLAKSIKHKILYIAAIVFAAVVGGLSTTLVKASIPDASGQISACYRTSGGDLRVRDVANPTDTCSNKETAISWSNGGGKIYTKDLVIPIGSTDVEIFTLPDFGKLSVGVCNYVEGDGYSFNIGLWNSTNKTVAFMGDTGEDIAPSSSKYFNVSLNGGFTDTGYMLSYTNESVPSHKTASLIIGTRKEDNSQGLPGMCHVRAQAVVSN